MDNETRKFIVGEPKKDLLILYDKDGNPSFKIERVRLPNGCSKYREVFLDYKYSNDIPWNEFPRNYYGEYQGSDKKSKSTGGKKPYVMLMTNEIKALKGKLKEDGVKNYNEIIGCLTDLSGFMEWSTGKLIDKRQRLKKKQTPLKYNDLLEISGYSKSKFENMMKLMKYYQLLWHSDDEENKGYFISQIYFKKGKGVS